MKKGTRYNLKLATFLAQIKKKVDCFFYLYI